jgi:hypothetical protein
MTNKTVARGEEMELEMQTGPIEYRNNLLLLIPQAFPSLPLTSPDLIPSPGLPFRLWSQ